MLPYPQQRRIGIFMRSRIGMLRCEAIVHRHDDTVIHVAEALAYIVMRVAAIEHEPSPVIEHYDPLSVAASTLIYPHRHTIGIRI
jgi:hypothetical protein